jgi:hypothetical protein
MRASEFLTEHDGQISKRHRYATVGLNTFGDAERMDGGYTAYRVMMASAMADGTNEPIDIDAKSWHGKRKTAHPYTQQEQNMLKQAFKAVGADWQDLNHGDLHSDEPPGGNTRSPVEGFKGYPR